MNEKQTKFLFEKLERMDGQLLVAHAAIRGLIASHPEPRAAAQHVERMIENLLSQGLGTGASDVLLEGVEQGKEAVIPAGWIDLMPPLKG